MKCPRCEYEMSKIKVEDNIYYYKCRKCGYQIGKSEIKKEEEKKEEE